MAARPEERYASARALADDLTRWLADEPVSSHREGLSARLGRSARRHRAGVQAGAAALAVTALFATTAALVVDRARRGERSALIRVIGALDAERAAKAEADVNLTLARQAVDDYFTKISENALLKRQDATEVRDLRTLRRELLEVALDYYTRLIAHRSADPSLRRSWRLHTRASAGSTRRSAPVWPPSQPMSRPERSGPTWRPCIRPIPARNGGWPRA